jgi:hypothetical protein
LALKASRMIYQLAPGLPRAVHWTRPGNRRQIKVLSHALTKLAQPGPSCILACCSHMLTALFRTRETDHPRADPEWEWGLHLSRACASMAGAKSIIAIAAVAAAPFLANVSLLIFFLLDIAFEKAVWLRLEQRR